MTKTDIMIDTGDTQKEKTYICRVKCLTISDYQKVKYIFKPHSEYDGKLRKDYHIYRVQKPMANLLKVTHTQIP